MRDVFPLRESMFDVPIEDAHAIVMALEDVIGHHGAENDRYGFSPEVMDKLQRLQMRLYVGVMGDEGLDKVMFPDDQETKTALAGVLAQAEHDKIIGTRLDGRPNRARDLVKKYKLSMPGRTAQDVNADPNASDSAKVAADRELDRER